jgi:hypothetical protein
MLDFHIITPHEETKFSNTIFRETNSEIVSTAGILANL